MLQERIGIRRSTSGVVKLNSEPVTGTSYVDRTVRPGQTYFYGDQSGECEGNREYRQQYLAEKMFE